MEGHVNWRVADRLGYATIEQHLSLVIENPGVVLCLRIQNGQRHASSRGPPCDPMELNVETAILKALV